MTKPLSILYVTGEVLPLVKTGGIADVSYSFPLAIRDIGHDIRVMIPKYGCVSERKNRIHEINRLKDIPLTVGSRTELATVKSSSISNPRTKVQAYITTNENYFNVKKGIYADPESGELYEDNDERFIFFNKSVIETCLILGWFPDIIHCNDWSGALLAAYAKTMFPTKFKKTKFVFTVHNLNGMGVFPMSTWAKTGLPEEAKKSFVYKKKINFTKGGLLYADYVTTVSPTYAEDLRTDKSLTDGMCTHFKKKGEKFTGILNGIDGWGWLPKTDPNIRKKFNKNFEDFKYFNKENLLEAYDMDSVDEKPVIGMISRLDEQKGIPLLLESIEKFLEDDIKFVMLGDGGKAYKDKLQAIADKYPDKFGVKFGFNDQLAHQLQAGSDIFLIPSKEEPCGLNAMYTLAYGAIPVVSETGGLTDIVQEYDPETKEGNGIFIKGHTSKAFVNAVNKALVLYRNTEDMEAFAAKNMVADYTWKESAEEYDKIYRAVMKD